MSRAGYSSDYDQWDLIRWRGAVKSAIRGRRGQKFLSELLQALDALPSKRLIKEELQNTKGEVCALGSLGVQRKMQLSDIDPEDYERVAAAFDITQALACEIEYENDEGGNWDETPEQRFIRVRAWVVANLATPNAKAAMPGVEFINEGEEPMERP